MLPKILVQACGNQRQSLAALLAHDNESEVLQVRTQVVGRARQVEHDAPVSALSEADKLVVLSDDLAGAAREVEGKGCLVRAEVVDVEDEFLREVLGIAPDDPAYAWVDQAVLVTFVC
jgi:uncharacterized protein YfcZ (UPF0381/DUF406 family)